MAVVQTPDALRVDLAKRSQWNIGYCAAGFAFVGAAASGLPTILIQRGMSDGLRQIRLGLPFIAGFSLMAAVVLALLSCLSRVGVQIRGRALNFQRVSRLFFWLSFFFYLGMQLVTAAGGV